jgi:hypothetical protein
VNEYILASAFTLMRFHGVGIGMIEPKVLKEFEKVLGKLVGINIIRFNTAEGSGKLESITFGTRSSKLPHIFSYKNRLEISDCAWELWHKNTMLFAYLPNSQSEHGQHYLESLKNTGVTSAEFDIGDFSLTIGLDNSVQFKLLHSVEDSWNYTLSKVIIPMTNYEVKNETISITKIDI